AAVIGTLHYLPEPATGLRRIEPVRIGGRAFHVIDFPAGEVWPADLPALALAVRRENEGALARAYQYPDAAHFFLLAELRRCWLVSIPRSIRCCSLKRPRGVEEVIL